MRQLDELRTLIQVVFDPASYSHMGAFAPPTVMGKNEQQWKDLLMTIPDPSSHPVPKRTKLFWLHQKTNGLYEMLDETDIVLEKDWTPLVLYQKVDPDTWQRSGPVWARPKGEFYDGRFVLEEHVKYD